MDSGSSDLQEFLKFALENVLFSAFYAKAAHILFIIINKTQQFDNCMHIIVIGLGY